MSKSAFITGMSTSTPVTETKCWKCRMPINAATSSVGLDVKTPEPGDVSICFNCGEIGIFEDATTIREPTRDERLEIIEDTGGEITEAQIKLAAIHKEKAVFDK